MFFDPNPTKAIFLSKIDSTNRYLLEGDFPSGTSCLADFQTDGRGRKGRSWLARPKAAFLYSGLIEGPGRLLFRRPPFLPLLAGLALREAVLDFVGQSRGDAAGKNLAPCLQIKWPNDLVMKSPWEIGLSDACPQKNPSLPEAAPGPGNHKRMHPWGKLAGVLVESREYKNRVRLVIGIGLNWRGRPPALEKDARQKTAACASRKRSTQSAPMQSKGPSHANASLPPVSLFPETDIMPKKFLPFLLACLNQKLRLYYEESDAQILQEIRRNFYLKNRTYCFQGRMHRVRGLSDDGYLLLEDEKGRLFGICEAE